MFQADMSPKLLNVERLERKFASLTRSRESIQGLSTWIIRHKEFYKEIVNQWLDALTRDFNALTMFYVANDVIQNCARKKASEYRDAFATVLEKAVSLEKVKEIKNEVTRMITLWHERSIYDDSFFKKLEQKLNSVLESDESDIEVELSEADVIANFKLENLINSLKKLKTLEDELSEKKSFLEDIEEPVIKNMDNMIVRMESQKEMKKFDKYQKLVEDFLSLSDKVIAAEKTVLLDLKYSSIFYSAQNEDAKKVAHAYRIYGKKVKMVEKSLLEKLLSFPEPSPVSPADSFPSPNLECDVSQNSFSPCTSSSPSKNKEIKDGNIPVISRSPEIVEIEARNIPDEKYRNSSEKTSIPTEFEQKDSVTSKILNDDKDTKNDSKTADESLTKAIISAENLVTTAENISSLKIKRLSIDEDAPKSSKSPDQSVTKATVSAEILNIDSSISSKPKRLSTEEVISKNTKSLNESLIKATVSADDLAISDTIKSKAKRLSVEEIPSRNTKSSNESLTKATVSAQNLVSESSSSSNAKILSVEEIVPKITKSLVESSTKTVSAENKNASDSINSSKEKSPSDADIHDDCIDFLLEKAYDVQVKSKTNFKRKIDNLLKLKQAKACKLTKNESSTQNSETNQNLVEIVPVSKASENEMDPVVYVSETKTDVILKSPVSMEVTAVDEITKPIAISVSTTKTTVSKEIECPKVSQSVAVTSSSEIPGVKDDSDTKDIPVSSSFGFQTFPDIPTELLKNILDKHKVNMNLSTNVDYCSSSSKVTDSKPEKPNQYELNSVTNSGDFSSEIQVVSSGNLKSAEPEKNCLTSLVKDTNIPDKCINDLDEIKNTPDSSSVPTSTSNFLQSVQNVLECFTEKEPSVHDVKYSETLCLSPSMPLENTLKLYNCLMQKYSKEYSVPQNTFNPTLSHKEISKSENSLDIKIEHNLVEIKPSVNKTAALQNDNLEIMDMDVDSEDDS